MKAFKEWKRNATVDISNCKNGGDLMEVVMEKTWKAALEWALTQEENFYGEYGDWEDATEKGICISDIKRELNEER